MIHVQANDRGGVRNAGQDYEARYSQDDERTQSQFDVDDVDLDEDYERSSNSQLNTRNQTGELNHK